MFAGNIKIMIVVLTFFAVVIVVCVVSIGYLLVKGEQTEPN